MKIVWTDVAQRSAKEAAEYALETFGQQQVLKLADRIDYACEQVAKQPTAFPLEQSLLSYGKRFRYYPLFPNLEMVYDIDEPNETIVVLMLWNTRRNPEKLRSIISAME